MMVTAVLGGLAGGAFAGDYAVTRTLALTADSTRVWHVIGDFCDVDDWHPGIVDCALKVTDGRLTRVLTMADGSETVERRIASEAGLSYSYALVAAPLPIQKLTATFSMEPLDGTLVSWSARFTSDDPGMEAVIGQMMDTGLAAIAAKLAE